MCDVSLEHAASLVPPNHLLLDCDPNLGPLISRWEIYKFESGWYKSARILEALKFFFFFQEFLNLPSSKQDMSGPKLGDRSSNRWSGGTYRSQRLLCEKASVLSNSKNIVKIYAITYVSVHNSGTTNGELKFFLWDAAIPYSWTRISIAHAFITSPPPPSPHRQYIVYRSEVPFPSSPVIFCHLQSIRAFEIEWLNVERSP